MSSIGTKVSCPHLDQVHWSVPGWISHLCLRRLCAPCPSGCVARWSSLCPGASLVLSSLQCSSLSQLGLRIASTTLAPGLGLSLVPYPSSCQLGSVPRSVAPLCALQPLAPSFRVVLTEAAGLGGGSWFSPLCSPDRRSASRSTCSALPPVTRLSFGLGDFSFG